MIINPHGNPCRNKASIFFSTRFLREVKFTVPSAPKGIQAVDHAASLGVKGHSFLFLYPSNDVYTKVMGDDIAQRILVADHKELEVMAEGFLSNLDSTCDGVRELSEEAFSLIMGILEAK